MRRLASLATVCLLATTAAVVGEATAASAAGSQVTPGSVWTLETATGCQSQFFSTGHAFSAAIADGSGDKGKYEGTRKLEMNWTAGTAAGGLLKAVFHRATGVYAGTYTDAGTTAPATLAPGVSVGCGTVAAAPGSPSILLGAGDTDTATITGAAGVVPTGTVTFYVCGPDATTAACTTATGTEVGSPVAVSGSVPGAGPGDTVATTATSAPFDPLATGNYCFVAVYSGDGVYPSGSVSSTTDQCITVGSASPGVTTSPEPPAILLGNADADLATVTGVDGVAPTGTVTFYVCGPLAAAADCAPGGETAAGGTEVGSPVALEPVGPGSPDTATATSDPFTATAPGTYCFVGVYSGDTNFDTSSDGSSTDECFTVAPGRPNVLTTPSSSAIALGTTDAADAVVAGVDGITPTGTVDFLVCPWNITPCGRTSAGVVDLGTVAVSGAVAGSPGSVTATSDDYTPPSAGKFCFTGLYSGDNNYDGAVGSNQCFTVTSTAPVPPTMANPENSFGTGSLSLGTGPATGIWAAVNGYCTSKENGDEFLSAFDATYTWNDGDWNCSAAPTSETPDATTNWEYNGGDGASAGYSYDIVTPPSAGGTTAAPLTVQAYDPAYEPGPCPGQSAGTVGSAGGGTPDINAGGPGTSITSDYTLTYAPVPGDDADDVPVSGLVGDDPYVAPSADPTTCGQWATLFTIPAGSPDGYYRLQVTTPQSPGQNSDGVNAYGLRVYQGDTFTRCSTVSTDAWYSSNCPLISGQSALSTFVDQPGDTDSFYLAQVPASDAGTTMDVNLFDPGEGDHYIQVLDPAGDPVPFTWATTDGCDATNEPDCAQDLGFSPLSGSSPTGSPGLDVSQTISPPPGEESDSIFNDREVQLVVSVPANYIAGDGGWWRIQYTSAHGTVQDRITWSVVLGAPPLSPPVTSGPRQESNNLAFTGRATTGSGHHTVGDRSGRDGRSSRRVRRLSRAT